MINLILNWLNENNKLDIFIKSQGLENALAEAREQR
jgi:hypothetical protein